MTAIAAATLFGVFWNARFVQMDVLVTATTLWVVIGITRWVDHDGSPLPHLALAGAAAGLGFIAKGPVGWVCPGLVLFFYLAVTRRLGQLLRWELSIGALACLCVAAPWYLLLAYHGRADVVAEVLFRQNVSRFVNPWDHRAPFWYYLETFWVDMAPWGFFVPLAFALPRAAEGERRLATLSWAWIAAIVVFFSLARSKRSPYILPIAPAVAVLAGEVLLSFMAGGLDRARRSWFTGISAALASLFVAAGVVVLVQAPLRLPGAATSVVVFGMVAVVAGAVMAFDLLRSNRRATAPLSIATGTIALYLTASGVTLPALNAVKSARPVCEQVRGVLRPDDLVASYAFWNWRAEYRYYLGSPIENFFGDDALRAAWTGQRRVVLFVEGERLNAARAVIGDAAPAISGKVGGSSIYVFTSR